MAIGNIIQYTHRKIAGINCQLLMYGTPPSYTLFCIRKSKPSATYHKYCILNESIEENVLGSVSEKELHNEHLYP